MPACTLGMLADIRMGATLRGRDAWRLDPEGTHRLIQISDIGDRGSFRTLGFCRVSLRERLPDTMWLQSGDILFPNRGCRTTAAVFEGAHKSTFVGAQFFILRPSDQGVLPHYLAWALRTADACAYFESHRRGTNVLTLQKSSLENFEIPVPPLEVQHAIVEMDLLHQRAAELERRLAVLRSVQLEHTLLNKARRS